MTTSPKSGWLGGSLMLVSVLSALALFHYGLTGKSVGVRKGFGDCDMGRLSEYGYGMPLTTSHLGTRSRLHVSSPHSRLM